jgi:hypothetical protein
MRGFISKYMRDLALPAMLMAQSSIPCWRLTRPTNWTQMLMSFVGAEQLIQHKKVAHSGNGLHFHQMIRTHRLPFSFKVSLSELFRFFRTFADTAHLLANPLNLLLISDVL